MFINLVTISQQTICQAGLLPGMFILRMEITWKDYNKKQNTQKRKEGKVVFMSPHLLFPTGQSSLQGAGSPAIPGCCPALGVSSRNHAEWFIGVWKWRETQHKYRALWQESIKEIWEGVQSA